MLKSRLLVLGKYVSLFGTSLAVAIFLAGEFNEPVESNDFTGFMKWGSAPDMGEEGWFDKVAQFDFVAFTPGVWQTRQAEHDSLFKRNVDIFVGEYVNIHTITRWMKESWERGEDTQGARLWGALHEHLAVTTEGDTASIWLNQPLFDFFDPNVRKIAIDVFVENAVNSRLDWLFLDYFCNKFPDNRRWEAPEWGELQDGEVDLNRNGVGHWEDIEEQQEMQLVFIEYALELRAALPDHIMLIANGNLALMSDTLAGQLDGVYLEEFPRFFWGQDYANWKDSMDPKHQWGVPRLSTERYRNGAGWVMLGNPRFEDWSGHASINPWNVSVYRQTRESNFVPGPHAYKAIINE